MAADVMVMGERIDLEDATFLALVANAEEPMYVATADGIRYANAALIALLGYGSADELIGRTIAVDDGVRHQDGKLRRAVLRTRPVELEGQPAQLVTVRIIGTIANQGTHDFNNAFAVILSNIGFAIEDLGPNHPVVAMLRDVEAAARRATALAKPLRRRPVTTPSRRPRTGLTTGSALLRIAR